MKTKHFLFTLLLTSAVMLAQSSASESVGIRSNFSGESIAAYQKSSQGKVSELYEYLTLYSAKTSGAALKEQLRDNIAALFGDENVTIASLVSEEGKQVHLQGFLNIIENRSYVFSVSGMQESETPGHDHWVNAYTVTVTDGQTRVVIPVRQVIYFARIRKHFGQNEKPVWDISLGGWERD